MNRLLASFALSALIATPAAAQEYPTKPITMLVPFAAGGPTDTVARITADAMTKSLGQQVLVENLPGAGGTIAAARAAEAEPDGYTILIHHIGMSTAPTLYRQLSFKPLEAFAPIGLVTEAPMTIVARPDFAASNLSELIQTIKADSEAITYANAGIGAASHLCGMLFMSTIGAQMTTVPYKGNGPIMTDLMGSQIDLTCDQATNTAGALKANQIKGYAVTAAERQKALPDLPTTAEAGLPNFELSVWHGLYAPAGTPDEVIKKLTESLQAAVRDENVHKRLDDIATLPVTEAQATPDALKERLGGEITRWKPIIEAAGQFAD
ncbi:tripartite tricarboxylate transporter substrate-binding protein [Antarcticirhabdus aurantiaca]|uniref:tripartite tricarboxylate transporter substrate-binding protein n=1 Tax=Antarcticirhabdus aurantiaca TaxID=2606717 RepID=UPI00131E8059|nr:tripartite tricarboxylate transporter substrate-binding protein [Antarcticirhabdus aurantiaca]